MSVRQRGGVSNGILSQLRSLGGLTFFKDYAISSSMNADDSIGSPIGTFTATRGASNPATYVDSNGIIQTVTTSNIPRFQGGYYDANGFQSKRGLMMETEAENLVIQSNDLTSTPSWGLVNATATTDSTVLNPDGTDSVKITTTDASHRVSEQLTVTASTKYTFSFYVRGGTQSAWKYNIYDVTNAGDIVAATAYTAIVGSWVKIQVSFTTPVACVTIRARPLEASGETGTTWIWGVQLETGNYATSLIPTTTASLTRNAELLTYKTSGNRTKATESIFYKFTPIGDFENDNLYRVLTVTSTKQRLFMKESTNDNLDAYGNGTDSSGSRATGTTVIASGTSYTTAVVFQATGNPNANIYVAGISEGTTNTDFTSPDWGTDFDVGGDTASGINQLNGIVEAVAIFSDVKDSGTVSLISGIL